MICYKEVCKYNGEYFSVWDNTYRYRIGEIAKPKANSWIWATDSIESCRNYGMAKYDIAILKMETIGEYKVNGTIVTAKAVRILKEVTKDESRIKQNGIEMAKDKSLTKLFAMVKEANKSCMYDL